MKKYSKKKLLRLLKKLYEDIEEREGVKRRPTRQDLKDDPKMPCAETYIDAFGSWQKAL